MNSSTPTVPGLLKTSPKFFHPPIKPSKHITQLCQEQPFLCSITQYQWWAQVNVSRPAAQTTAPKTLTVTASVHAFSVFTGLMSDLQGWHSPPEGNLHHVHSGVWPRLELQSIKTDVNCANVWITFCRAQVLMQRLLVVKSCVCCGDYLVSGRFLRTKENVRRFLAWGHYQEVTQDFLFWIGIADSSEVRKWEKLPKWIFFVQGETEPS